MARPGETKTSERQLRAKDRQREALELRKAGATFPMIAERLEMSLGGAHKAVMTALKATIQEPADEVRKLEVARLDAMLLAVWTKVRQGDPAAINSALKIMHRRALLLGLDAPVQARVAMTVNVRQVAEEVAAELGLPIEDVIADAERRLALEYAK